MGIILHVAHLMQLMAKMSSMHYTWMVTITQLEWNRIDRVHCPHMYKHFDFDKAGVGSVEN